jgi:hypothetical protein
MENSTQNHINKSPDLNKKSIQKNNYQSSQDFPQFSIVSSNNRKTYKGPEHPSKRWGHSVVLHNNNMIIFGGRHSQRILSNIYSLDFTSLSWSKIEPCGNSPPARDSHSAIIYNDSDMIMDVIEHYKGKYDVRIVETGYEFQKHANRLLIIKRV